MNGTMRRTKIVATIGPATSSGEALRQLLTAGTDVVRLNFSHGEPASHVSTATEVRRVAAELGRTVGVLADLQGPKIRIGGFQGTSIILEPGQTFTLDAGTPLDSGTQDRVGLTYPELYKDVSQGDVLLLDDGRLELQVEQVAAQAIRTQVLVGGELHPGKGINLRAGGLSAGAITDKDREDMRTVAQMNADYVALSFVRSAADVVEARQLLASQGWSGGLLAKIERNEALDRAQEILEVADGIMVARGDLGVEIGDAKLPEAQKRLIRMARIRNRVVITATQMMESMIDSPLPTRAEVFDVANAVLDGTDAVMLSAETAVGRYPSETVVAMGRVCLEAEKQAVARISRHRMDCSFGRVDETIAMSAMYAANHTAITAIAALTESGDTCLWMSRISSGIPIYGLSFDPRSGQRMSLYRGVYPVALDLSETADTEPHELAANELIRRGAVQVGDLVLTTCGDEPGKRGGTNSMHISIIKQRT